MKSYPSIPTIGSKVFLSGRTLSVDIEATDWIGFDKLDGSLIRAEWEPHKGFWKFGRRNGLLDDSNPVLLEAPDLITKNYGFLDKVMKEFGWTKTILFFEFYGKNSFAGSHEEEQHFVSLIDISLDRKGLVDPKELRIMDVVGGSKIIHIGQPTLQDLEDIYEGKKKGVTFEGVVFKRNNRKGIREMFKCKSKAWYEKLRQKCSGDDKLFERLK